MTRRRRATKPTVPCPPLTLAEAAAELRGRHTEPHPITTAVGSTDVTIPIPTLHVED